jgi:hypothetical protein
MSGRGFAKPVFSSIVALSSPVLAVVLSPRAIPRKIEKSLKSESP